MLDSITPVILTFNEAPNIGRILGMLAWAKDVVVVDSGSTDETVAIAKTFPNVRVFHRDFDRHASQWNFAVSETGIGTEWILALDADYRLSAELVKELGELTPAADVSGYRARFVYCVEGRPLRATVYTPVTVLFRREGAKYAQDGHTQRVQVSGRVEALSSVIYHDDRKPLAHWVAAQERYTRLEAAKLRGAGLGELRWPDRVRKLRVVAPFLMLAYCLFGKGLILDGRAGVFYSFQRAFAEMLLSLYLLRGDFGGGVGGDLSPKKGREFGGGRE